MKRKSIISLVVMLIVTLCCGLLIPHININTDLTEYLPKESSMKHGIDTLKANFPFIDTNAPTVRAMFPKAEADSSLVAELKGISGIVAMLPARTNEEYTLYTLNASTGTDLLAIQDLIVEKHPNAVVETNANSNMPGNMGLILLIGAVLVGVILFVMCGSFMEAILFIVAIGLAVVMNMGTNAFLPSVSMMTNTIVALLQFVLSMDYSIILMNRYRLVKTEEPDSGEAMRKALKLSRSSILSSSLTTIVGLLALVFMKFRIGLDLGVVLAKGVLFSLISIYTILPGLILIFEKAILATTKRVPVIPTKRLAFYEIKFRWVLAGLFLLLFAGSYLLQKRTELSYASIWESKIDEVFEPQTNIMVLYKTAEEEKVIALLDTVAAGNPKLVSAVSYPSIMERPMTAEELFAQFDQLKGMMPEGGIDIPVDSSLLTVENLKVIYYAASHPVRDEKASLEELMACLPPQIDVQEFTKKMMPAGAGIGFFNETAGSGSGSGGAAVAAAGSGAGSAATAGAGSGVSGAADSKTTAGQEAANQADVQADVQDSLKLESGIVEAPVTVVMAPDVEVDTAAAVGAAADSAGSGVAAVGAVDGGAGRFTYESVQEQMDVVSLSEFLKSGVGNTQTIFKMAGRKGSTMSPQEFIHFVNTKILANKMLSGAISKQEKAGLAIVSAKIDSALNAGPTVGEIPAPRVLKYVPEGGDSLRDSGQAADVKPAAAQKKGRVRAKETPVIATPYDELLEMTASGKRYDAAKTGRALRKAGVNISQDAVDLLFTYYGSQHYYNDSTKLSINKLLDFVSSTLSTNSFISEMVGDQANTKLVELRAAANDGLGMLRGDEWSFAAVVYESLPESDDVFEFVEQLKEESDTRLQETHFLIGESVMYKEMKDGFGRELAIVTFLTIVAIFLIVCISFRSVVIPTILIMAVLTGVFVNVYFSGFGGNKMLYIAYLIVQSILMGATIDYAIVFTNFYRDTRRAGIKKVEAMRMAYKGSINTIMTSGLIMVLAPAALSIVMTDPTIKAILSSLSIGALSVILVIILLLPGTLAACDKVICRKK